MVQFTPEIEILTALVADLHNQNGGASLSLSDLQGPSNGYMVSLRGYERILPFSALTGDDIRQYIADNVPNARRQKAGELFIGTWYDGGRSYLDLSVNVADEGTALEMARNNSQLAVYDVKNQRSIYTEDLVLA